MTKISKKQELQELLLTQQCDNVVHIADVHDMTAGECLEEATFWKSNTSEYAYVHDMNEYYSIAWQVEAHYRD